MLLWGTCRTKFRQRFSYIHAYAGIFRHTQRYSEIIRHFQELLRDIQAHSEACVTLIYSEPWHIQNPYIFGTLIYSEFWYIQNPGIFRTLSYSETDPYSECWYIQDCKYIHNPPKHNRGFYENNANSFLHIFLNIANSDLHETHCNNVELVFNILAYSVITRHIQEVSRDIMPHSQACVTLVYSEPWYIQNPDIFRNLAYSEPWYIQ